jgi:hypothetical protein
VKTNYPHPVRATERKIIAWIRATCVQVPDLVEQFDGADRAALIALARAALDHDTALLTLYRVEDAVSAGRQDRARRTLTAAPKFGR